MLTGILGEKISMAQVFAKGGKVLPVTKILAGPVTVVQIKTTEKDGYLSAQIGFGAKKRITKPILGHLKKANAASIKVLAEFKLAQGDLPKLGDKFTVDQVFEVGDLVQVTGISKGKGFQGVVKRWGFAGGPKTHGQTDRLRAPGSIGQTTTPGRVMRGKKMPGRMGQDRVTVKNLEVIEIDGQKNSLVLSGSIPGSPHSILRIEKTGKVRKPFERHTKETEESVETAKNENNKEVVENAKE